MKLDSVTVPKTGVIIGKFFPPHNGHCYLVDFGLASVDVLYIFVCSLPSEIIPGLVRVRWMKELFPSAQIVHIEEVNPNANRNQPNAHLIWANAIMSHIAEKRIDYLFASEPYGWSLADSLGAKFIPLDPSRDQFPISGTEAREKPFKYWNFLPRIVRNHYVKHISFDPVDFTEETISILATLWQTKYIPDYKEFYKSLKKGRVEEALFDQVTHSQLLAIKKQSRFFVFSRFEKSKISKFDIDLYISKNMVESTNPQVIYNFVENYFRPNIF